MTDVTEALAEAEKSLTELVDWFREHDSFEEVWSRAGMIVRATIALQTLRGFMFERQPFPDMVAPMPWPSLARKVLNNVLDVIEMADPLSNSFVDDMDLVADALGEQEEDIRDLTDRPDLTSPIEGIAP